MRVLSLTAVAVWLAALVPVAVGAAIIPLIHPRPGQLGLGAAAVAVVSLAATCVLVDRLFGAQLARIRQTIRRLSAGEFDYRVGGGGHSGVDSVMQALDDLAGSVETRLAGAQDAERRYRLLFEQSPASLFRTRPDGRLVECNTAAAKLLGFDRVTKTHNVGSFYANAEDRDRMLQTLAAPGEARHFELPLRRGDGSQFPALLTLARVETGNETFLEGQVIDLSVLRPRA